MSSFLNVGPELLANASADLSGIGEAVREATAAALPGTTGIAPPALDEISAAVTRLFGNYGEEFQALSAQGAAFHARFAQLLGAGGNAYSLAELGNVNPLQSLMAAAGDFQAPFSPWLM